MKLSKISWLILGIGILLIGFISLYMVYRGQVSAQAGLNQKIAAAQATLPKVVSEREGLEGQLTKLKNDLARITSLLSSAKAQFPKSVQSIEYGEILFKMASDSHLDIVQFTASPPESTAAGSKETKEVTYSVTLFEVGVEGGVDDILDYVNTIATSENFTTAAVEPVDIVIPEPLTESEEEALREGKSAEEGDKAVAEAEKSTATIKITIYGYKGE